MADEQQPGPPNHAKVKRRGGQVVIEMQTLERGPDVPAEEIVGQPPEVRQFVTDGLAAMTRLDATFKAILDSGRPTPADVATLYLPAIAEDWPKMTALLRHMAGA